jgi:YHS domain-containing protein
MMQKPFDLNPPCCQTSLSTMVHEVDWTYYGESYWFSKGRWMVFFYVHPYKYKTKESTNQTFGTSHSNVQLKILHHTKLPFCCNNLKQKTNKNPIWCGSLKANVDFATTLCSHNPCFE